MTCLKVPKNNEPAISATNKTLADILSEMRNRADTIINGRAITERNFVPQETVEDWADRIESAYTRDIGSATVMREALGEIDKNTDLLDIAAPNLHPSHSFVAVQIRKIVRAALDAPFRNCDVGSPEEQSKRFEKFCESHPYKDGVGCRCNNCELDSSNCEFAWAQMPFKEEK